MKLTVERPLKSPNNNFDTVAVMDWCSEGNFVAIKENGTEKEIVALDRHIANRCILVNGNGPLLAVRSLQEDIDHYSPPMVFLFQQLQLTQQVSPPL